MGSAMLAFVMELLAALVVLVLVRAVARQSKSIADEIICNLVKVSQSADWGTSQRLLISSNSTMNVHFH